MKVIILRGVSGSGKSTYAAKHYPDAFVVSADHYFMVDGVYTFRAADLGKAHADCLGRFVMAIQNLDSGTDIVVDNTNTTAVEIAPYAALAMAFGCELEVVTLNAYAQMAFERNLHGVPFLTVVRQAARLLEEKLPAWWPQRTVVTT